MTLSEPTIKEFMTQQPQCIGAGESIEQARRMMSELEVRHLPVMKEGVLAGILSERELNLAYGIQAADAAQFLVIDVCSQNPCVVTPDTPLRTAAKIMADRHLGSLLVVAESGELLGIFTTSDACQALHDAMTAVVLSKKLEEVRGKCSYEY